MSKRLNLTEEYVLIYGFDTYLLSTRFISRKGATRAITVAIDSFKETEIAVTVKKHYPEAKRFIFTQDVADQLVECRAHPEELPPSYLHFHLVGDEYELVALDANDETQVVVGPRAKTIRTLRQPDRLGEALKHLFGPVEFIEDEN